MRRVKTKRLTWGQPVGTDEPMLEMSVRDYRLMLAVVRACEWEQRHGRGIMPKISAAMDAFNSGGKRK